MSGHHPTICRDASSCWNVMSYFVKRSVSKYGMRLSFLSYTRCQVTVSRLHFVGISIVEKPFNTVFSSKLLTIRAPASVAIMVSGISRPSKCCPGLRRIGKPSTTSGIANRLSQHSPFAGAVPIIPSRTSTPISQVYATLSIPS